MSSPHSPPRPRPYARIGLVACAVLSPACAAPRPTVPPAAPTPREATEVAASMGHTWDAVIDMFAARNIPIRTIERASGIIATDELSVGDEGETWAVCGQGDGTTLSPNFAIYNVLVRGDSTGSRVMATVRWTLGSASSDIECATTRVWERELESAVKHRAESQQRRAPEGAPSLPAVGVAERTFASSTGGTAAVPTPDQGASGAPSRKARGLRSGVELLGRGDVRHRGERAPVAQRAAGLRRNRQGHADGSAHRPGPALAGDPPLSPAAVLRLSLCQRASLRHRSCC